MELFFSMRRSGFIIYYLVLAGFSVLLVHIMGGAFPGVNISSDTLKVNGVELVYILMSIIFMMTTFIVASFSGAAAMRDYRYNSHEITFSYPLSRSQYLLGKFTGIYLANVVLFTAPLLGYALACQAPWLNRALFLPFAITTYSDLFLQKVLINIFFLTAAFYVLGLLVRNTVVNWIAIIVFYILYFLAGKYYGQSGTRMLAALIDPYGLYGTMSLAVGSSAEERNTNPVTIEGLLLWNRVLWTGVGVLFLFIGLWRFRFSYQNALPRFRKRALPTASQSSTAVIAQPATKQAFGTGFAKSVFFNQLRLECRQIFRNVYFYLIGGVAILFLVFSSFTVGLLLETPGYPTTIKVLETFTDAMSIFLLLLIMIFSGEAVWRDKQYRLGGITGSAPAPQWVRLAAKTVAVYLPVLILLAIIFIYGILLQTVKGYYHYDIPVYIKYLLGHAAVTYLYYTLLAVGMQLMVPGKYQGYFLFAAYCILFDYFGYRIIHQGFLVPGYFPEVSYSDITGFQGSFYPFLVYAVYWLLFALLVWRAGVTLQEKSMDEPLKKRWISLLKRRKRSFGTIIIAAGFVGMGIFIAYNTNILNKHHSPSYYDEQRSLYETKYSSLKKEVQLSVSAVKGNLELYPSDRKMKAGIVLTLVNKNTIPVNRLYLNLGDHKHFSNWESSTAWKPVLKDDERDFYGYEFAQPVAPGDSITLKYDFTYATEGFTDNGVNSMINRNGTFINNTTFFPVIGYDASNELDGNKLRKQYKLSAKPYANLLTDPVALQQNMLGIGADRVRLQLTIGTDKGQTAMAPGYLTRQWEKDGRSYFTYEMDQPAVNYFSIQSGRYKVKTEACNINTDSAQKAVQLSILYHPDHSYNTDLMMTAMKDALSYYSNQFGPYQYRQLRIVEFPNSSFAQSYANTIPFSENIGFLADLRDTASSATENKPADYVYYVTAHEVAHQWWAHQILPANTEGANFLCEALAQYSALMLMKHKYGEDRVRKFLAMESFKYLSSRGSEEKEERPLVTVMMEQQYIFYQKGGCIMYALQHYLGEQTINTVLKQFVRDYAFKERPYVTADVLVNRIKAAAPDSLKGLVSDCLEKVIVYNNKIKNASYVLNDETLEYTINATIEGKKLEYNAAGKEKEVPMNDWMEIGIYNKEDNLVATQKVKVQSGSHEVSFESARRPDKIMITPDFDLQEKDYLRNTAKTKVTKK